MDPRAILGIGEDAGDDEIRAAYLRLVKEHPPEASPEQFERIRDAYDILRDPKRRTRNMLFSADPFAPLTDVLNDIAPRRRFTGPAPWLEVLKGK
jgi:curved DNA-binding protein CbpA